MSFSGNVKEELSRKIPASRHCRIAEIAAIISMCGAICINSRGEISLKIRTENLAVARKCFTLLAKTFNINVDAAIRLNRAKGTKQYFVAVKKQKDALLVLSEIKLIDQNQELYEELFLEKNALLQKKCCRRAYLRGVFLASGSMSAPEKFYHFEIVCPSEAKARQIQELMRDFELDAKILLRKKMYVVYLKEGNQIADILMVMEASQSMMELENVRILKDMRNTVNRKVNCEMANLNKTVSAAVKQREDILFIERTMGLDKLPESLREIAEIRIAHPEASLKELGNLLRPPVGKSGVNHRLRKLGEIAEQLGRNKED